MNFGFIGVGQAGCNMVNYVREFPCLAINTAIQDLSEINISNDYKIHTKVTHGGGAGKNIAIGEKAIIDYKEIIANRIKLIFKECDYLWIVSGLGGGTGSLGCVQLISILGEIGMNHGVICTLPMEEEGTQEKINAVLASNQLFKAQECVPHFRSLIFIDNNTLKDKMLKKDNLPYEQLWHQSNELIFGGIKKLIEYSKKSSFTSFDPEDYKRALIEKGTILISDSEVEINSESDLFLANKVKEMWQNDLFITGDINHATGCIVILERPNNYDKDSKAINILFQQIKESLRSGFITKGIYATKQNLTDAFKSKKIKIFTLLSGIPFPIEKINALADQAKAELEDMELKKVKADVNNMDSLLEYLREQNALLKPTKTDLSLFNLEGISL